MKAMAILLVVLLGSCSGAYDSRCGLLQLPSCTQMTPEERAASDRQLEIQNEMAFRALMQTQQPASTLPTGAYRLQGRQPAVSCIQQGAFLNCTQW